MDFRESPIDTAFRAQVREFIQAQLPEGWPYVSDYRGVEASFMAALAEKSWVVPAWPKEFGGAGLNYYEQFVFNEEMAKSRAPSPSPIGVSNAGPVIIRHGSDEQKAAYLPGIANGTDIWCQGFSEPGAGSDLAGLKTRAEVNGDSFVVNGQKIWTSYAHRASRMLLLARTDPTAPKHRGISAFLVPMDTPGIDVRPLQDFSGERRFNEVYFEDVVVPRSALLGELNRGWFYARSTLEAERSGIRGVVTIQQVLDEYMAAIRRLELAPLKPRLRSALAERYIEVQISRTMALRVVSMQVAGQTPIHEASCNSLFSGELAQRVAATGLELFGMNGQATAAAASLSRNAQKFYLRTTTSTVRGGTKEIQRNVIATRGLGLPRE